MNKKNVFAVIAALNKGTIRNAGGVLIDSDGQALNIGFEDLRLAIKDIYDYLNVSIERIDSGGNPTWDVVYR